MREREKEERERKIDREKERIIEERGEKIEKGEIVHRKEVKGEAERDLKRETEEGTVSELKNLPLPFPSL